MDGTEYEQLIDPKRVVVPDGSKDGGRTELARNLHVEPALKSSDGKASILGGQHKSIVVVGNLAGSMVKFRGPLLSALAKRGHRVTACAPVTPPGRYFAPDYMVHLVDALAASGIAFQDVPIDGQGVRIRQDIHALGALAALFRKLRPDIVLSYTIKPVLYGSLAARLTGVPKHFSMITGLGHAFSSPTWKYRVLAPAVQSLYRLALKNNEKVFFQNPDDRALFEKLGIVRRPDQAVLIHGSGIDLDAFSVAPLPKTTSFLLLARLIAQKGIYEYVEAARSIRARHPEVAFRLAGRIINHQDAIPERTLRAWVEEGAIEYLGRLEDVRPAIAASSVYVLPSYYREGTPRSTLEAMAMGRPVVTTDAPGCRETVQDGVNGYLVPLRDAAALAAALKRFIAAPALAETMGRESRRIAVEKFDVDEVNEVILESMDLAR